MPERARLSAAAMKAVRWSGYVLLALALVYCGLTLRDLGSDALLENISEAAWISTLAVGLAYGAALAFLAMGWSVIAARQGQIDLSTTIAIYGPAVVAKYIPGSIFQYGSRQLTGAEFNLDQKSMVKASFAEAGLHIPAALFCAGFLYIGGDMIGLGMFIAIGLGLVVVGKVPLVRAAGFQLAFFAVFSVLMGALAGFAFASDDPSQLAAFFMLAWVAGFLVPVAPGGIGVRESVLLALAVPSESAAVVAAFALLSRFATTIGDAAIGFVGYWFLLSRRWNRQASV